VQQKMSGDNKKGVEEDQERQVVDEEHEEKSDLRGDYGNVALLLLLYVLQGIPLGISGAVRIMLTNRGVSFKELAILSFASYPFTSAYFSQSEVSIKRSFINLNATPSFEQ
jgi:hypothetical protein